MGMEIKGRVHAVFETKQVSERFTKREFVVGLADNPKYPQVVLFQLTGDRVSQLDGLEVGDDVRVEFNLRGREWCSPQGETKYFNSLEAWKVERVGDSSQQRSRSASREATSGGGGADDDIPFASCELGREPSSIAKVLR